MIINWKKNPNTYPWSGRNFCRKRWSSFTSDGESGAGEKDKKIDWCIICSDTDALSVCCTENRAGCESEAVNLLIHFALTYGLKEWDRWYKQQKQASSEG